MKKTGLYILILLFFAGCSMFKKDEPSPDEDVVDSAVDGTADLGDDIDMPVFEEEKEVITPDVITVESFYPLKETLEDLRREVSDLKSRIDNYETSVSVPSHNPEILKMVKKPRLEHRITLSNGTIIHGNIKDENADRMIVETQLGELTLEKGTIKKVGEVAESFPNVELTKDPYGNDSWNVDKLNSGLTLVFSGTVVNKGLDRADFVRVVCALMGSDKEVIVADSGFVDGTLKKYSSGVISDCTVEPGEQASWTFIVDMPKEKSYEYDICTPNWSDLQ